MKGTRIVALLAVAGGLIAAAPATQPGETGPVLKSSFGEVAIFPADNPWNRDVSKLPVHPRSAAWIGSTKRNTLHPDFGTTYNGAPNGIPFVVVPKSQPRVAVKFEYADESDPGPYPIPKDAPIEGGPRSDGDRHVLVIVPEEHKLYEVWKAYPDGTGGWKCGSGAVWDLATGKLRPAGWTSGDAAGLPVFPGLVRYEEVEAGTIRHALRFTVEKTQRGYILPATHWASSSSDPNRPPMGMRVRLRAGFDITPFPKQAQVILACMKTYGLILADNGGDWYISGAPNPKWDDEALNTLKRVKSTDLEVVDTGPVVTK